MRTDQPSKSKLAAGKLVASGVAGLNAAAIIFLYTNFVPRTEYDKLESDFKKAKEELLITKATLDVFRGQMAANYD